MDVPAIEPDETFTRLIWDHTDIQNGVYQTSIIATKELTGRADAWSVDRHRLIQRSVVEARDIHRRTRNPDLNIPLLATITYQQVLSIADAVGQAALDARPDPTEAETTQNIPANPAHALVYSRKKCGDAAAKQLRRRLLELLAPPKTLDQYFQEAPVPGLPSAS
jgi:hypothetical protein